MSLCSTNRPQVLTNNQAPAGCHIRTLDHVITANKAEDVEVHSKWLDWTWSMGELFNYPDNETLTATIVELCTKISGKFHLMNSS